MIRPATAWGLGIGGLLLILALTLFPVPELVDRERDIRGWAFSLSDLLVNIGLFAPLGAGMAFAGRALRPALATAACVSVGIELTQWMIPGRSTDLMDVVSNVAGAGLGFYIADRSRIWLAPEPALATRLFCAAGLAAAGLLALAGWLLVPSVPDDQYYAHAPPEVSGLDPYPGSVDRVELDGVPLARNRLPDSARVAEAIRGDFELRVWATLTARPGPQTGLFMITADGGDMMLLLVTLEGEDLVLRYRDRATLLRLQPTWLAAKGVLEGLASDGSLSVGVRRENGRICLDLYRDASPTCALEPRVDDAWSLYVPQLADVAGRAAPIAMLCMALLAMPLGFWYRRSFWAPLVPAGVAAVALVIPLLTPMRPLRVESAIAAIVGLLIGVALARVAQRASASGGA